MGDRECSLVTRSAEETRAVARALAADFGGGEMVLLTGPLGAGKSVFARGIADVLGARSWRGSPTFTLVNEYATTPRLAHIDLYRLAPSEVEDLGLEEYAAAGSVVVVEWADRASEYLRAMASNRIFGVDMAHGDGDERMLTVTGDAAALARIEAC